MMRKSRLCSKGVGRGLGERESRAKEGGIEIEV